MILVDGGGRLPFAKEPWQQRRKESDVGKDVLLPYLRSRGIDHIDWVVMTHGDMDHIGGLQAIAEEVTVGRVIRNPRSPQSTIEKGLMDRFQQRGVPISLPDLGSIRWIEPGISWQFLHPPRGQASTGEGSNEDSVVFLLRVGNRSFLFTGDTGKPSEASMLKNWDFPPIDLIKVGHHGSRTSTSAPWVEALQPQTAVISVGRENRFGHPAPEVITRLQEAGTQIWRTDQQGAIIVTLNHNQWKIDSMVSSPP